ncbi:hypothetical protein G6F35_015046 [Rhizopus arrhizus]|nr:hypothetical protein G6F35_015046 [Rhizopus arrhizus]
MRSKRARSTLRILPRNGSTAWFLRLRPCLAEPPAESPSTMNSSDSAGSFSWQSASLPGSPAMSSAPLRRVRSRALRAASRARAASTILPAMALASFGFSCRNSSRRAPKAFSTAGRTSELTSFSLPRDHAFAHVVAGQVDLGLLGDAVLLDVVVEHAGQRTTEAGEVGTAVLLRDVVGEAVHRLLVGVGPLQRHVHHDVVVLAGDRDDVRVQRGLQLRQMLHEAADAAFVVEVVATAVATRIGKIGRASWWVRGYI